jgi:NADH-quinone oxidoreductase subunit F
MVAGNGTEEDIDTLLDVCDNIFGRSFCALGDGAVSPIVSGIKYFRDEFLALCNTNKASKPELVGARA